MGIVNSLIKVEFVNYDFNDHRTPENIDLKGHSSAFCSSLFLMAYCVYDGIIKMTSYRWRDIVVNSQQ